MTHRRGLSVLVVVLATAHLSSASALGTATPPVGDLTGAMGIARSLQARADAIRADVLSSSLARAIDRMLELGGLAPGSAPAPSGPPAQRSAIDQLMAAVQRSFRIVNRAWHAPTALTTRSHEVAHRMALDLSHGRRIEVDRAAHLQHRVRSDPAVRATAAAAAILGAALDRTIPELGRLHVPPASPGASPCDVVDRRPWLCVAGEADSIHDANAAAVQIDLGGNDTYTATPGTANSASCAEDHTQTPWCIVSVSIDIAGDDVYLPDPVRASDGLNVVALGAAVVGVGILIDAAGNDRYQLTVPHREPPLEYAFALGGATVGVGLLADQAGNDRYEVSAAGGDVTQLYVQGAVLNGAAALIDGGGRNRYIAEITGAQPEHPDAPTAGNDFVQAQGVGLFGAGVMADRSGRAELSARTTLTGETRKGKQISQVISQGVGLAGSGTLITGSGPTTYSTLSLHSSSSDVSGPAPSARLPGGAYNTSQGVGAAGTGLLDDAGGDDVYRAIAGSDHTLRSVAEAGCGCDAAVASLDTTGVGVFGSPSDEAGAGVSAQGLASAIIAPDAGALLRDGGGDDVYEVRASTSMTAVAENRLTGGDATAEAVRDRFPVVNAFGQGLGSDEAPGIVSDASGDDAYLLEAISTADAVAEAPGTARSVAYAGLTTAQGQGSSYWDPVIGALLDHGGQDAYRAVSASRAETSPNAEGAHDSTEAIGAQGAVGGLLADLDDGVTDEFESSPAAATVGFRGEGPGWVDIDSTFPGYGVAPQQPAKRESTIELDPANPTSGSGGSLAFRARVTDAQGAVPGTVVTFDIETGFVSPEGIESWGRHRLHAHGVTGENGWATGWLDLGEFVTYWDGAAPDLNLRIAARFAGDVGRRAAEDRAPFDVP